MRLTRREVRTDSCDYKAMDDVDSGRLSDNGAWSSRGGVVASTAYERGRTEPGAAPTKGRRESTLYNVTSFIIVNEFCERLAYYGFASSLVLLLERRVDMTNEEADSQYALWSGVCYVTPLFGGWIADSYLGRYNTILLFSLVYLAGLMVAAAVCTPGPVSAKVLLPAMYVLALGTGGIKSSVSVFGAEQFDDSNPRDVEEKQSYFNWFYWSINFGALISHTLVSYICQYGLPFLGGKDWGFFVGFTIPCVAMTLSIIVFVAGTPRYVIFPPAGSVLGRAAGIVTEAACLGRGKDHIAGEEGGSLEGDVAMCDGSLSSKEPPSCLERARGRNGGSYSDQEVADVVRVGRLLPFLLVQVPYWAVYAQMSTAFQNQGCQMDLTVLGFDLPVAALNVFDTLAILCLIPVADRVVYPWFHRQGWEPTMLRRIGAGLLLAALSVIVAAGVEVSRRRQFVDGVDGELSPCRSKEDYDPAEYQAFWATKDTSDPEDRPAYCHRVDGCSTLGPDGLLDLACIDCDDRPLVSNMNVMWQMPQFLLIGASEILTSVTSLEFFYAEAPQTMRGVSAGLNLFTTALGTWVTIPLLKLVNSGAFGEAWVPDDLNEGHLEHYFFLLAGLVLISFVFFIMVARGYTYKAAEGSPTSSTITQPSDGEDPEDDTIAPPQEVERRSSVDDGLAKGDYASASWESTSLLPASGPRSDGPSLTLGRI